MSSIKGQLSFSVIESKLNCNVANNLIINGLLCEKIT